MGLITILNHCHRHRGFVYQHARFGPDMKSIAVHVRPREGSAAVCSGCHQPAPGYDHLPERSFEFNPLWGFLVFLLYRMRRVDCWHCGVVVEEVPWSDGKHQLTRAYMLFLAQCARKLSWKDTAKSFHTSWDKVCDAVEYVVGWGLEHRTLDSIRAIGVDEIQYAKGHKYLTLVYQIDHHATRLLWVGKERTIQTVRAYLLKEDFQRFWKYNSPTWAGMFLDFWCHETMRSRVEPMKKIARMLRTHRELLLNYFKARKEYSSGVVEGLNNKAKVTMRRSYGFRTFRILELAFYHSLGKLPEPELTHEFF